MKAEIAQISWGKFLLQLVTIAVVYLAASAPAIIAFGETSNGALGSVVGSMCAALLIAWFWMRRDGSLSRAWNLSRPESWPRTLLYALGATLAVIAWFTIGAMIVEALGFDRPDTRQVLGWVTETPLNYALWVILVAWFAAGLGEELLWRGFLLDRLTRLKGIDGRIWLALAIQAVLFGLPHAYQGWGGVIITGFVGLLLGWLRIKSNWNLWACVIAHAAVDTTMMTLAFARKAEWVGLTS